MKNQRIAYLLFAIWVIALASTPWIANNYIVKIATFLAMYAAIALSWNFIGGFAGYPSFATGAFIGLGAYSGALLQNTGWFAPLAWGAAMVIVVVFAALVGKVILKMKGHYFAIGSIALVEVLSHGASSWSRLTGGGEGLNVAIMAGGPDFIGKVFPLSGQ